MRAFFVVMLLSCSGLVSAQVADFEKPAKLCSNCSFFLFEEVVGSSTFVDINSDGFMDVVSIGESTQGEGLLISYINDGNGVFEVFQRDSLVFFSGQYTNATAFADVNGDGFIDMFYSMKDFGSLDISEILMNDGQGNFIPNSPRVFSNSSYHAQFVDYDGDGDFDLARSGNASSGLRLFKNDGQGNFTEDTANTFIVYSSEFDFADIDGDGDQDVYISTIITQNGAMADALYLNDGNGLFTEDFRSTIEAVRGVVHFEDFDNDGDMDLFSGGQGTSGSEVSDIYKNDGTGLFTKVNNSGLLPFLAGYAGRRGLGFADLDLDNDIDIVCYSKSQNAPFSRVFLNDGTGSFDLGGKFAMKRYGPGIIDIANIDQSPEPELLLSHDDRFMPISRPFDIGLYKWQSDSTFAKMEPHNIPELKENDLIFEDLDNDGDLDIIVAGKYNWASDTALIYFNDGSGNYSPISGFEFPSLFGPSIVSGDVDNDGDIDIIYNGYPIVPGNDGGLYRNDGNGGFTKDPTFDIIELLEGAMALVNIDNDTDLDLITTGKIFNERSFIYRNDGSGNFTNDPNTSLLGCSNPELVTIDIDMDGDNDFIVTGEVNSGVRTKLFVNQGLGNFTEILDLDNNKFNSRKVAVKDLDKDGDYDVILALDRAFDAIVVYENDGSLNFARKPGINLGHEIYFSAFEFVDFNQDGNEELLVSGKVADSIDHVTRLYNVDTLFNFTLLQDSVFEGFAFGNIALGDIDGDGDEDVLVTGETQKYGVLSLLIKNGLRGVGLEDGTLQTSLSVYPNPSSGLLRFKLPTDESFFCQLYNIQGEMIDDFWVKDNSEVTLHLNQGLYILTLNSSSIRTNVKLVIE
ncbi:MAG: T9SS type A sorting domain-containing protein [Bacteroidetes bacterium]|nr:T9SS type A sorting domain-containing protein [Bacteroidota bacterium]